VKKVLSSFSMQYNCNCEPIASDTQRIKPRNYLAIIIFLFSHPYAGSEGTITFTMFPLRAGDTLKGTISATVLDVKQFRLSPPVC
jgi:hypothetical protein